MKDISIIKASLHKHCTDFILAKLETIQSALDVIHDSLVNDSKSTAGDKHETGRAMAQLEQEKLAAQLSEALKMKAALETIRTDKPVNKITSGSLIVTDNGSYYISIAAGRAVIDKETYFCISPQSPIGKGFLAASLHSVFSFNGTSYKIRQIV